MNRAWWVLVVAACGSTSAPRAHAPQPTPPAVEAAFDPPAPTLRLPRHFTPARYTARLAVDPAKPDFAGEIAIEGTLDRLTSTIWLHGKHLEIARAVASDGRREIALAVTVKDDLLGLHAAAPLEAGAWTLKLTYRGQIEHDGFDGAFVTKYGGDAYLVTQFEATAARLVFPCLDEPDRKAVWQLTLDVPNDQLAVSNTPVTGSIALDPGHVRITFGVTRPLPSYLVAFAVGPFEAVSAGTAKSGLPLRVITPRTTASKVAFLASALPKLVDTLEAWFAIPFPYAKLDIVIVPSLRGGAMENAGMITCDSRAVMIANPSAIERYNIVSTIGHETSHQWFGDLVTAAWWDDIWLNESFATWMEDKVLVAFDPAWPTEALDHRFAAERGDRLTTARKIRQEITNEGDIHNAFDEITYPKGATVLRMLEHQLGEAAFRTAIQTYLRAHADGNATAADLFAALDTVAPQPLGRLATGWFDQAGVPEVAMDLTCDGGGKSRLALSQQRYLPSGAANDQTWTIPVCIAYEGANHERVDQCLVLAKAETEIELPVCPNWFSRAGDYGYFIAKLDAPALTALLDKGWDKLTHAERIVAYGDVAEYARRGKLPVTLAWAYLEKLAKGDPREQRAAIGDLTGNGGDGMPIGVADVIPKDLMSTARAKARAEFEGMAKRVGILDKPGEPIEVERLRADLLDVVVWTRSRVFDDEAKVLAAHYHDLPNATMRAVLELAANADPKIAAQLRADLDTELSPVVHETLLATLAGLHDPQRHRAMIESLVADPKLGSEDLARMWLYGGEEARADDEAYLRVHLDDVRKRLPTGENEDFPVVLFLYVPFVNACDPARRDEIATYVTEHFSKLPSAARPVKQAIELMDNCIASKRALEPALRAWLHAKS
ncbi:MAG: M1 family aminopeptidase [Kofleriaceae bacterium]